MIPVRATRANGQLAHVGAPERIRATVSNKEWQAQRSPPPSLWRKIWKGLDCGQN